MVLMELKPPSGRAASDVYYHLGELLLEADREQAAYRFFQQAVDEWDQHTEAKRRLRLRTMRNQGVGAVRGLDAEERARRAQARAEDPHFTEVASAPAPRARPPAPVEPPEEGSSAATKVTRTLGQLFKRK